MSTINKFNVAKLIYEQISSSSAIESPVSMQEQELKDKIIELINSYAESGNFEYDVDSYLAMTEEETPNQPNGEAQNGESNIENDYQYKIMELEERLKYQQLEATRRENLMILKLSMREQELQDCINQLNELRNNSQVPSSEQLDNMLMDPAVNIMFEKMKEEVDAARNRVEEMQNELSAWKFTPDSNTGKRLMAKCRQLYQENEELGKMIESGKTAKMEGDLAMQKKLNEQMKKSQTELDEFIMEMDEDVEALQTTILQLQSQLKEATEKIKTLEAQIIEIQTAKTQSPSNSMVPLNNQDVNESEKKKEIPNDETMDIDKNSTGDRTSQETIPQETQGTSSSDVSKEKETNDEGSPSVGQEMTQKSDSCPAPPASLGEQSTSPRPDIPSEIESEKTKSEELQPSSTQSDADESNPQTNQ